MMQAATAYSLLGVNQQYHHILRTAYSPRSVLDTIKLTFTQILFISSLLGSSYFEMLVLQWEFRSTPTIRLCTTLLPPRQEA